MPTARLRSASLGADLELQGGATKAGPGTPGRRLTGPSEARLPPRRVLGSCPGGQWLGQGGAAEEQAGRTSGLAGRAGSPAAAPDAVAMVEKRVCHPFVHGLAPWFGAGSESLHEHHVPWGDVRPSPRPVSHGTANVANGAGLRQPDSAGTRAALHGLSPRSVDRSKDGRAVTSRAWFVVHRARLM